MFSPDSTVSFVDDCAAGTANTNLGLCNATSPGSAATTTCGFREAEAAKVGNLIADVLDNPHDLAASSG